MVLREVVVGKKDGFQRADYQALVQKAMSFSSSVNFEIRASKVNGKSLMGVMSMGLKKGDKVMVIINGQDQDDALEEIVKAFE